MVIGRVFITLLKFLLHIGKFDEMLSLFVYDPVYLGVMLFVEKLLGFVIIKDGIDLAAHGETNRT